MTKKITKTDLDAIIKACRYLQEYELTDKALERVSSFESLHALINETLDRADKVSLINKARLCETGAWFENFKVHYSREGGIAIGKRGRRIPATGVRSAPGSGTKLHGGNYKNLYNNVVKHVLNNAYAVQIGHNNKAKKGVLPELIR